MYFNPSYKTLAILTRLNMKHDCAWFSFNLIYGPPSRACFRSLSLLLLPLPPFFDGPLCLQVSPGSSRVTRSDTSSLNVAADPISRYFVCESAFPLVLIRLNCMAPYIIETYVNFIFDQTNFWRPNEKSVQKWPFGQIQLRQFVDTYCPMRVVACPKMLD